MTSSSEDERRRLIDGGEEAVAEVFSQYRERLERMVAFRLDPRIRSRVDSSDILQEAFIEISRRIGEFISQPAVSCFVWMRQKTLQTLIDTHRRHFRDKRDPKREVCFTLGADTHATSESIARQLVDEMTSPSQAAMNAEEIAGLQRALESMNEIDREVLALRHFEQLNNNQVAEILGTSPTAASNRYVRAATRLGEIISKLQSRSERH